MTLHARYPSLEDLRQKARKRLPLFVFEYLDSGTGAETALARQSQAFDAHLFRPSVLNGPQEAQLTTSLLGMTYARPFGIAPVGMSGLIWPDAERLLAREAKRAQIPYTLSTVAAQTPEHVAPELDENAWFQLYPPKDESILKDLLNRAKAAGFRTLVFTADLPAPSRRERQVRSGLAHPPRFTPRILAQCALRPAWSLAQLRNGRPSLKTIEPYAKTAKSLPPTEHIGYLLRASPDYDYLARVRDLWDGPLIVKGLLDPEPIPKLEAAGADALWVSGHGGRQFDGAPTALDALPTLRKESKLPLIFDSGIRGGLDILRALALGADFVMLGRAWHYALAALGPRGAQHMTGVLEADMRANLGQIGVTDLSTLTARLCDP